MPALPQVTDEMKATWKIFTQAGIVTPERCRKILWPFDTNATRTMNVLTRRRGFAGVDTIQIERCGIPEVDHLTDEWANETGLAVMMTASQGFIASLWTLCVIGPDSEKGIDETEKRIAWKGWRKTDSPLPKPGEYKRISVGDQCCIIWVEPINTKRKTRGSPEPSNSHQMGGQTLGQEELYECCEDGDEVGPTVLQILQRGINESATAGREEFWWVNDWFQGPPTGDQVRVLP